jgi:alpha-beta hydrolase superfamily lysophospholipase
MSPMLGIRTPLPDGVLSTIAKAGAAVAPAAFALKQGPWRPEEFTDQNTSTNSPERQAAQRDLALDFPELQSGGATWGWLRESMEVTERLMQPEELARLEGVDLHVLSAEGDQVVRTDAQAEFCQRVGAELHGYRYTDDQGHEQGAKHVLLAHDDRLRQRVLADVRELVTAPPASN